MFITILILINVLIAWANCYSVGMQWPNRRGGWDSAILYSAAVQSVAGFSIPIVLALTAIITHVPLGKHTLTPDQVTTIWHGVMNLWYLAVIIPVVGTGFVLTVQSIRIAFERRDFSSIAVATWNTGAQISNTVSLVSNFGSAFGGVKSLFKSRDNLPLLVIMLVLVSLLSSVLLTVTLIQYYARKSMIATQGRISLAKARS